jgi:hypothetical protein
LTWVCSKLTTLIGLAATLETHHVLLKQTSIVQFTFMEDGATHSTLGVLIQLVAVEKTYDSLNLIYE